MQMHIPWPAAGWPLPADVRVEGGALVYRLGEVGHRLVKPELAHLHQFVALATVPEGMLGERVLDYARKYGPLGLCPGHGLPKGHPTLFNANAATEFDDQALDEHRARLLQVRDGQAAPSDPLTRYRLSVCGWPEDPTDWVHESLSDWRRFAWGARAVRLLWGSKGSRDRADSRFHDKGLWAALLDARILQRPVFLPPDPVPKTADALPELRRTVGDWLLAAHVPLALDPATGGFVYLATTLFGGLAMQLALTLSRGEILLPCSKPGCPETAFYVRRGSPPFCGDHRNTKALNSARQRIFRANHPGYYTAAARAERAARGAGRRLAPTDRHEST